MHFKICIDDLSGPQVTDFLEQHLQDMRAASPPESMHALDLERLKAPDITFWSVWEGQKLVGCGALKQMTEELAELKSMRTSPTCRGKGIASYLLQHILTHAKHEGYQRIYLETGSMDFFIPARKLYEKFGFQYSRPFGDYQEDPDSVFMCLKLEG